MYNPNNTQNFTSYQQINEITNKNQNLFESKYAQNYLDSRTNSNQEYNIEERNLPSKNFRQKKKDQGYYDPYLGTFVKYQERDTDSERHQKDTKLKNFSRQNSKKPAKKENYQSSNRNASLDYRKILDFETYFRQLEQAGKNMTHDEITEGRVPLQGKRPVEKVNSENKIYNSQGVPNLNANPIDLIRNSKRAQFGNFYSEIDIKVQMEKLDDRLAILGKDQFSNKRILEVGCGNGLVGQQIVKFFDVRSYKAVDIDYNMINKCLKHRMFLKNQEKKTFEKFSDKIFKSAYKYDTGKSPMKQKKDSFTSKKNKDISLILDQMPLSFKFNQSKKGKNMFSRMKNYFDIKNEKPIESKFEIFKDNSKKETPQQKNKVFPEESFIANPNFSFGYNQNETYQPNFEKNIEEKLNQPNGKISKFSNINQKEPDDFNNNYDFYESLFKDNANEKLDEKLKRHSSDQEIVFDEPKLCETNSPNFLQEKPKTYLLEKSKSVHCHMQLSNNKSELLNVKSESSNNQNNQAGEIQFNNTKSKTNSFTNSISPNYMNGKKCNDIKIDNLFFDNHTPEDDLCQENGFYTPNKQLKNTENCNGATNISSNKKKYSINLKKPALEIDCDEINKRKDSRKSLQNDYSSYFNLNKDFLPYRMSPKEKIDPAIENGLNFFQNVNSSPAPKNVNSNRSIPKSPIQFSPRSRINSNTLSNCGYNADQTPQLRHESCFFNEANDNMSLKRKKSQSKKSSKKINKEQKSRYDHITFDVSNYIEDITAEETYDILVCFSLTKWVQLNWGDYGLLRQFKKLRSQVKLNGLLILEPQQWRSYKKKKNFCKGFEWNFKRIWQMPDQFPIHLKHFGFDLICVFENDYNGKFKRPIYVYKRFF